MNTALQSAIVFAIVATAVGYASLKLMPGAWRRSLAARASAWAAASGLSEATSRRVEAKLSTGGACGSCDSCKACATPPVVDPEPGFRRIPIRRAS